MEINKNNGMRDLFDFKYQDKEVSCEKPLEGVRFALLGNFSRSKQYLSEKIKELGGNENVAISKYAQAVVIGDKPSEIELLKLNMLNHDGFNIPVIDKKYFLDIIERKINNFTFHNVKKNIEISYDFIFDPKYRCIVNISDDGITHKLGLREIFIGGKGNNVRLLHQIIGNLAGYATNIFDPSSTDYIMIQKSTVSDLRKGLKDDVIKLIENTYNNSKSDKFTYKFIIEDELLSFAKRRSLETNDKITLYLINEYEERKFYSN